MKHFILFYLALSTLAAVVVLPTAIERTEPIATAVAIALSGASGTDNTTMILLAENNNNPAVAAANFQVADAGEAEAEAKALSPTAANTATTATKPQITYLAHATQTTRPSDPEPIIIFPFSIVLTESCSPSPPRKLAKALVQNGQFATLYYNLSPTTTAAVDHRIPDFPRSLRIGPYDGDKGEVWFSYLNEEFEGGEGCRWRDGENWRECGECRAGMWDSAGLDCGKDGGGGRVRCSFILGWKHQFHGLVAAPASSPSG
ncbi:hypothetical protein DDE82_007172 [Stemphylium lycopersici]|uniref:Uncharacterized protein n=1 Tax=Stemphylium lycopersici TaxID=183478 RepID=A0A364N0P1_STELY|nr:hypothetical protein TW65_00335 [Stemphylium lycopersici]RAR00601.1 hypothetical protein DDE82_007172 [Stemphylium lycopersici]RAR08679.1 hypothetical protein DDE83_005883 [Stemphylium lycopersici]